MANDSVTLFLEGSPTIDDYVRALSGLRALLQAISSAVAPGVEINWRVDALEASSALTSLRGESSDMSLVERAAATYLGVGRALRAREHVEPQFLRPATRIRNVLTSDRVPSVRFETAQDDVTVSLDDAPLGQVIPFPSRDPEPQLGAVEGRVQTLSARGSLRFILFDLVFDKAVTCYLAAGQEDLMRDAWGQLAIVEGRVKRDPASGRPTTVRQVSEVLLVSERERGAWRSAAGVQPSSEPAETRIRRIRDAQ